MFLVFDYKFHCFNGKLAFIEVSIDRYTDYKINLYDPDWNFIGFKKWIGSNDEIEKPQMFNNMKSLTGLFAQDFRYVRVDLYCLGSEIYFGELTFHPGGGFQQFIPQKWDSKFGEELLLD